MKKTTKKNLIAAICLLLAAALMTGAALWQLRRTGGGEKGPVAEIIGEFSCFDPNPEIRVTVRGTVFRSDAEETTVLLSGAFRELRVASLRRVDDTTLLVSTEGKVGDEYSVGYAELSEKATELGEPLVAATEIDMSTAGLPVIGGSAMEDIAAKGAKALIVMGIKKIPYVGGIAANLLGPTLNQVLGIKPGASIQDVMDELAVIEEQLKNLSLQVDKAAQDIMEMLYKESTFGKFNDRLTSVSTTTDDLYHTIGVIFDDSKAPDEYKTSDEYKAVRVAELLSFDSRSLDDYANEVKTLMKYLDGSQISCTNQKGIFENAFLSGCKDSVLGGEAAMRAAPYLNQVSSALSYAYKAMIIVLDCKNYVIQNLDKENGIVAKSKTDPALASLLTDDFLARYRDPTNVRLWGELADDTKDESIRRQHNLFFGDEDSDSLAQRYNELVVGHWFDYIRDYRVTTDGVNVEFVALSSKLTCVKPTEIGLDRSKTGSATEEVVNSVHGKLKNELYVLISQDEIVKLLDHVIANPHKVFLDEELGKGQSTVEAYPLDILKDYGFDVRDCEGTPLFLCSSSGSYDRTAIYGTGPTSPLLGYDYESKLSVRGLDCSKPNGYTVSTGNVIPPQEGWKDVRYYYYYKKLLTGKTERDDGTDYCFYYFAPSDVEIDTKDEFLSFIESVASGKTYKMMTVNLNCDVDLTGESYAHIWGESVYEKSFQGKFNGNGHTIKGLTDKTSYSGGGLFRTLGEGAQVFNLILVDPNVTGSGKNSGYGALAGRITGNVRISGVTVTGGSVSSYNNVGGIVGEIRSGSLVISDCTNGAAVTAHNQYAGGIVGASPNKQRQNITICTNTGEVKVEAGSAAGGIIAYLANDSADQSHQVKSCINSGNVTTANGCAGGIIGHLDTDSNSHQIKDNRNSGRISAGTEPAGGIVGFSEGGGIFTNCKNTGDVSGKHAGGIVGSNEDDSIDFSDSSNEGNITGTVNAGGIAGYLGDNDEDDPYTAKNCTNTGKIKGENYVGGIFGHLDTDSTKHDVSGSTNAGEIVSTANDAGGIVGYSEGGGNFTSCRNTGAVSGRHAGGIVGSNEDDAIDFSESSNEGNITGTKNAGGIAGYLGNNSLDRSYAAKGCVNAGTIKGENYVGGIVGHLDTDGTKQNFSACTNAGEIVSTANDAGGIVGCSEGGGDFTSCKNTGAVSGRHAGGVVGSNEDDAIDFSGSSNEGDVTGTKNAGGIAGYLGDNDNDKSYTAKGCANTGKIKGADNVGGIVGHLDTDGTKQNFSACTNAGEIAATGSCAGGIIGFSEGGGNFTDCKNASAVSSADYAGGIVGRVEDDTCDFTGCENTGTPKGSSGHTGQICGYDGKRKQTY